MPLTNMPMFDLILAVLQKNTITQWTANEFWKHLKLSKKDRNRFNRQRMYRLLRKLVENGFLVKKINTYSPCLSNFSETEKLNELRNLDSSSTDFLQMKESEEETQKTIYLLEKQIESFNLIAKKFPNSTIQINVQKTKCLNTITDLRAYKAALGSVLTSI